MVNGLNWPNIGSGPRTHLLYFYVIWADCPDEAMWHRLWHNRIYLPGTKPKLCKFLSAPRIGRPFGRQKPNPHFHYCWIRPRKVMLHLAWHDHSGNLGEQKTCSIMQKPSHKGKNRPDIVGIQTNWGMILSLMPVASSNLPIRAKSRQIDLIFPIC